MKHFLITGYPRSGTAWLANLFTWGPALCVHDPYELAAGGVNPFDEPAFAPEGTGYLGYSDSGMARWPYPPEPGDGYPLAFVWRRRSEALGSFKKLAAKLGLSEAQAIAGFDRCADATEVLHRASPGAFSIAFEELGDARAVDLLWKHLLPEVPFPSRRFELLKRLRITSDLERRLLWGG